MRRNSTAAGRLVMVATCLLFLVPASLSHAKDVLLDDWYSLEIEGSKIGWSHSTAHADGDRISTMTEMKMTLKRGAMEINVAIESNWEETTAGKAISAGMTQDMSAMKSVTKWTFSPDGITIVEMGGGQPVTREAPLPEGTWLTPHAAFEYFTERVKAGEREIKVRTMSPEIGPRAIMMTYTWLGEEKLTIQGKEVSTTSWNQVNEAMPTVPSKLWISSDGVMVRTETNIGIGNMRMELTDRKIAQAEATDAPEVFFKLLVEPDREIPNPWEASRTVMRVRAKEGSPPELPSVGCQSIAGKSDDEVTIVVDINAPQPATAEELADDSYLGQSVMIDPKDDQILELRDKALADLPEGADLMLRVETLRSFVFEYIVKKDLGTAFASASEVARTRSGDCSEHGVLLAALLRADGLPARVVTGLVYVPRIGDRRRGAFGWHMWSQALVDGNWVDVDATLPVRFSGGHVTTGTSSLSDSAATDMASIVTSLGNIEIDVVQVDYE